jgi:hypothetical protein
MRRALHDLPGPTHRFGEPALADALFEALGRASDPPDDHPTEGLHGFHSYPARMHQGIIEVVLDAMSGAEVVIDPFCGSGTTLIEAQRHGMRAIGSDLNPLGVHLARMKTAPWSETALRELGASIQAVGEHASDLIRGRAPHRANLPADANSRYDGHVMRALGCVMFAIDRRHDEGHRRVCRLIVSAILPKLRLRQGDTDDGDGPTLKRIGRFMPATWFVEKGQELITRLRAHREAVPKGAPSPIIIEQDARQLADLTRRHLQSSERALVLTSPPYGGTYDYAQHHADRLTLLGMSDRLLWQNELGARRNHRSGDPLAWDTELRQALMAMADGIPPGSRVVLLQGDGIVGDVLVAADEQIKRLAPGCGLTVNAGAAAPRPDWWSQQHGARRFEHLIALTRR